MSTFLGDAVMPMSPRVSCVYLFQVLAFLFCSVVAVASDVANAQAPSQSNGNDLRAAIASAMRESEPDVVEGCPGCCSSHGGISSSCAGNGNVICNDGTTSPTCGCSSCGVSPPPPPTCTGGTHWDGFACVCPSGESLVNGVCTAPVHTCNGGSSWNGTSCICPAGESFVDGICAAPSHACSGGMAWNGRACACPSDEQLIGGICRSQTFAIGGGISGSWYDPLQSGHGFLIEVIKDSDQAQIVWFAFDNDGRQAWISAIGPIEDNRIRAPALHVEGGRFPPNFRASDVERNPWGTLEFTFSDCDHASMTWSTNDPDFTPAGSMSLQRLTQIEGTSCP
jgi:hypothetical protein